jgi:H+/Cl- antiporter ClcA
MSSARRNLLARLAGGTRDGSVLLVWFLRWVLLGIGVGIVAGFSAAALLASLTWATDTRVDHGWIVWFLPVAGLVTGCLYHYTGGRSAEGNNLIIDEIHEPRAGVPRRMAPLIFFSTFVTQLFGGSAGREGTGIQLSVGLSDSLARYLPLTRDQRRILMIAAMSAGFGALFGVPLAGAVFGLEVQSIGRVKYEAIVPAFAGSLVGDLVVRALGVKHPTFAEIAPFHTDAVLLIKVAAIGVIFGLVGAVFIHAVRLLKAFAARHIAWTPLRPFLGGFVILALMVLVGNRDYLGLSLPLASSALAGDHTSAAVFALKLLFTVVTLGFGFYGGEVTPLFVIGSSLGAWLATIFGLDIALVAALGYVAVFAGAANVPLTCTLIAVEVFGGHLAVAAAVACVVSYVFSTNGSIYSAQRLRVPRADPSDEDQAPADPLD